MDHWICSATQFAQLVGIEVAGLSDARHLEQRRVIEKPEVGSRSQMRTDQDISVGEAGRLQPDRDLVQLLNALESIQSAPR